LCRGFKNSGKGRIVLGEKGCGQWNGNILRINGETLGELKLKLIAGLSKL
jgi:hypothetical protein